MMLIADEVHHLGANHTQNALMDDFSLRLGLSATPERWYDEEGTQELTSYFDGTVFNYGLEKAIESGALCEYYYIPHIVELQDDEMEEYMQLTGKIGRLFAQQKSGDDFDIEDNQSLQTVLFKRARLIGTAREKLDLLTDLFKRGIDPGHSLVYCSDGSTGLDDDGERHIDATTARLREECDLTVERFTARENQAERERLLAAFEEGDIPVLTSIRCLDEGVDVPATRTAYLLASTSNPRQYVQRRGRILRQHANKKFAVIHDFITIPDTDRHPELLSDDQHDAERTLIRKELERVTTFAESARNHPDADVEGVPTTEQSLREVKRRYDLLTA
jgi:superfamily II DNA or RNA helicase